MAMCDTHKQYILNLQKPLYELVKKETDLRLQHLILVTNHPSNCLRVIIDPTGLINWPQQYNYKINKDIYETFLSTASNIIRMKCEKGINLSRFKKEVNEKTLWNTLKGYWFHIVPVIITTHLWIPLLKDIAGFYQRIALHWTNQYSELKALTMLQYLHKKFLVCLLEVNCQINEKSNPSGSLIQAACWKLSIFQEAIITYFDDNRSYTFSQWMKPKMNVLRIVSKYIKEHAQMEYKAYIQSIGINEEYEEFKVNKLVINSVVLFDQYNSSLTSYNTQRIQIKQCTDSYKTSHEFQSEYNFNHHNMNGRIHRVKYDKQQQNNKFERDQSLEQHIQRMRNGYNNSNNNQLNNNNSFASCTMDSVQTSCLQCCQCSSVLCTQSTCGDMHYQVVNSSCSNCTTNCNNNNNNVYDNNNNNNN